MTTQITQLPTPPSRQRPSTFSDEADAFLGALPVFGDEANALAVEVNTKAVEAGNSATLASQWATKTGSAVVSSEYSAKEYAVGTVVESAKRHASGTTTTGSAKDWATKSSGEVVAGQGFSAKKYATDAAASASAAYDSASTATTKASEAASSAASALASANSAAASYDSFDDRYLGPKSSDPTEDNDGQALIEGALYWNTSSKNLRVWNGTSWQVAELTDAPNDSKVYARKSGSWLEISSINHAVLSYETYAEASAAAATLPDGQIVDALDEQERYKVQDGVLVFVEYLRSDVLGSKKVSQHEINARTLSPTDFNATGDGVVSDVSAFDAMSSALVSTGAIGLIPQRPFVVSSTRKTFSRSTNLYASEGVRQKMLVGTRAAPDTQTKQNPMVWAQKVVNYDSGSAVTHMIGGGLFEVEAVGSGNGAAPNRGTWIGLYGNGVLASKNVGTESAPQTDMAGNVIGVAGFAAADFNPGDGRIITGLWGYAMGPTMTSAEYTNTTGSWQTVGCEVNVQSRHPDAGLLQYLGGSKGGTAGFYLVNYQELGEVRKDISFGFVMHGVQMTGDYTNTDPDTWSGYHVGIQLDKIKDVGINFQILAKKNQTIGIQFPTLHDATNRGYKTAIAIGNNKINLGQYFRADSDPYDLWHNGEQLYWKMGNGKTAKIPILLGYFPSTGFEQTQKIEIRVGNKVLRIPAEIRDF